MKLISVDLYFGSAYGKLATFSTGGIIEFYEKIFFKKNGLKRHKYILKTQKKLLQTEIVAMVSQSNTEHSYELTSIQSDKKGQTLPDHFYKKEFLGQHWVHYSANPCRKLCHSVQK